MRNLGISIYPEKDSFEDLKEYVDMARKYGFSRIFTCLLSAQGGPEEIMKTYGPILRYANELGYEIAVDVNPEVLKNIIGEIKNNVIPDLKFFKNLGVSIVRFDGGFDGSIEANLTHNTDDILIEVNMMGEGNNIDSIMQFRPNQYQLIACHNFYPKKNSGESLDLFRRSTNKFRINGIRTAAFVYSENEVAEGPWPVTEGLCTLEMHRGKSMYSQFLHYVVLNEIDDIIISNYPAKEEEMKNISSVSNIIPTFDVILSDETTDLEKEVMTQHKLTYRSDSDLFAIRTGTRSFYKGESFPLHNSKKKYIKGDIIIDSDEYGQYKGELSVVKEEMESTGKSIYVGHIVEEQLFVLDYLKSFQTFILKFKQK